MKSLILVLSLLLADPKQEPNSWKLLSKVEIERRYDETFNFEVEFPIFSDEVKALDGKPITMEGWMIPLDELRGKNYLCYQHCLLLTASFAGAGPETVMEVFSKKEYLLPKKRSKYGVNLASIRMIQCD